MAPYVKTQWVTGDLITAALMNKLETQYDAAKAEAGAGNFPIPASAIGSGSFGIERMPNAVKTLYLAASGGSPALTDGCGMHLQQESAGNRVNYITLDFREGERNYATWLFALPDGVVDGKLTANILWTADSGVGNVRWGIQAKFIGDGESLDGPWGVAQEVTDIKQGNYTLHISPSTSLLTPAGTPGGRLFAVRCYRDGITDTFSADAKLIGIKAEYISRYQD